MSEIKYEIVARIESERAIVEGNRELIRFASREEKVKKVIERVWEGCKTLRVSSANRCHFEQESLVCGSVSQSRKPLGSRMMMDVRLVSLRELQSATGEELSALLPSVLDRAFKGEL
jgi:hypothetical protein